MITINNNKIGISLRKVSVSVMHIGYYCPALCIYTLINKLFMIPWKFVIADDLKDLGLQLVKLSYYFKTLLF